MYGHNSEAKKNNPKPLSQHMRGIGIDKFRIELVRLIYVPNSKIAKIQEQIELWKYPVDVRLNGIRAHIPNIYYRGNVEGKRANRRAHYARKKKDPVWMEKERQRNRVRMRIKRKLARDGARD